MLVDIADYRKLTFSAMSRPLSWEKLSTSGMVRGVFKNKMRDSKILISSRVYDTDGNIDSSYC